MEKIWLKIIINIICSQFALLMFAKIADKKEIKHHDYRLFRTMLITIVVILILHSIALITNGSTTGINDIILHISVSLLLPLSAFLAMTYAIHVEEVTNKIKRHTKHWIIPYTLPLILILVLSISSLFTGIIFYFDEQGYYHEGRFVYIPVILSFSFIFIGLFVIIKRKKTMNINEFSNIVSVPIPMIIAGSLQSFFDEYPILLPGCTLTLFLVFSNIQERRLSYDHLTGAFNRQKLDEFLEMMIEDSINSGKPFSAFLADVNKFKCINDNFGHTEGDKALIRVVETIKSEIRYLDFLARYAGDEFVVIFPNTEEDELYPIIDRINRNFSDNLTEGKKYPLSISVGSAVFDPSVDKDAEHYIKRLDSLMYQNKEEFHKKLL